MKLNQLEYLAKIVECGSMNQAARELYVSQSTLSRSILSLEEELGIRLLKRSNQGIFLTSDGENVYKDIQAILEITNSAYEKWKKLSTPKELLEGNVRVIACSLMCKILVNDVFDSFYESYPKLRLELEENISLISSFPDYLYKHNCNIGLNFFTNKEEETIYHYAEMHKMHINILGKDTLGLFLCKDNPLACKNKIYIDDLKNLRFVGAFTSSEFTEDFVKYFNNDYSYRFSSLDTWIQIVERDRASTILAKSNARFIHNENIVVRHIEDVDIPYYYYLIYPEKHLLSVAEEKMIEIIQEYFSGKHWFSDEIKQ